MEIQLKMKKVTKKRIVQLVTAEVSLQQQQQLYSILVRFCFKVSNLVRMNMHRVMKKIVSQQQLKIII